MILKREFKFIISNKKENNGTFLKNYSQKDEIKKVQQNKRKQTESLL